MTLYSSPTHTPAELAFLNAWQEKARAIVTSNGQTTEWDPVWLYRSPKREVAIHFSKIADPRKLRRVSMLCERQWLREISDRREEFCRAAAAGRKMKYHEAMIQFERELCKHDLYYLSKYVLGYEKETFHLHRYLALSMENLPPGYRGLREVCRDAYKTTVMSISFAVQQVLLDKNVRVHFVSNLAKNASNKMQEARGHFIPSSPDTPPHRRKRLPELFPEHAIKKNSQLGSGEKWFSPCYSGAPQEGTFSVSGVGGSGRVSQHYDIIIPDDFWDQDSVTSPAVAAQTKKDLTNLEFSLANPAEGRIIFIGTRFAHDDPTQSMIDDPRYECIIISGLLPCGRSVFPENLTITSFIAQSRARYAFSCHIMLNPSSADAALDWNKVGRCSLAELFARRNRGELALACRIICDAAGSDGKTSDNAAFGVLLVDHASNAYLVGGVLRKMGPYEFVQELFRLFDQWRPEFFVIQKATIETTIQSFLNVEMEKRSKEGKTCPAFHRYSLHKREKKMRITAALQPLINSGRFFVDPSIPFLPVLQKEVEDHPNSGSDNMIDALSEMDDPTVLAAPFFHPSKKPTESSTIRPSDYTARDQELHHRHAAASLAFRHRVRKLDREFAGRATA